jgi:hypothetical protein
MADKCVDSPAQPIATPTDRSSSPGKYDGEGGEGANLPGRTKGGEQLQEKFYDIIQGK